MVVGCFTYCTSGIMSRSTLNCLLFFNHHLAGQLWSSLLFIIFFKYTFLELHQGETCIQHMYGSWLFHLLHFMYYVQKLSCQFFNHHLAGQLWNSLFSRFFHCIHLELHQGDTCIEHGSWLFHLVHLMYYNYVQTLSCLSIFQSSSYWSAVKQSFILLALPLQPSWIAPRRNLYTTW